MLMLASSPGAMGRPLTTAICVLVGRRPEESSLWVGGRGGKCTSPANQAMIPAYEDFGLKRRSADRQTSDDIPAAQTSTVSPGLGWMIFILG